MATPRLEWGDFWVRSNSWRGSVSIFAVASMIAAGLALPHGALAQSSDSMLVAQTGEQRAFNIPPQPLGTALGVLGQQSGRNISVDGALVRGLSTEGVQGTMTIDEYIEQSERALDRLRAAQIQIEQSALDAVCGLTDCAECFTNDTLAKAVNTLRKIRRLNNELLAEIDKAA